MLYNAATSFDKFSHCHIFIPPCFYDGALVEWGYLAEPKQQSDQTHSSFVALFEQAINITSRRVQALNNLIHEESKLREY
jgi:hypothetical protein